MSVHEERKFLIKCIRLYRDLRCLWDKSDEDYHNRYKKEKSYNILLAKYRERYPDALGRDLKSKLNILRTNYRKQLKKHVAFLNSGGDEVFKSKLWYYDEMTFLNEQFLNESVANSTQPDTRIAEEYLEEVEEVEVKDYDVKSNSSKSYNCDYDHDYNHDTSSPHEKQRKSHDQHSSWKIKQESDNESNDNHEYWAKAVAKDLDKMDQTQQIYAKRAIAEIIMEGQLGQLHRNSGQSGNSYCSNCCVTPKSQ